MLYKDTNVISAVDFAAVYKKDIAKQYKIYGNIIQNLSNKSIRIFRAIGTQWHQLLGLDSNKLCLLAKH
jgi:hypothetical protein